MKEKIKQFLITWLFGNEIKKMKHDIEALNNHYDSLRASASVMHTYSGMLRDAREALAKCMNVGIDVNVKGGSWAVICLKGKPEYVKFIDLGNADLQQIAEYLRSFDGDQIIIDANPFGRDMIWRELKCEKY